MIGCWIPRIAAAASLLTICTASAAAQTAYDRAAVFPANRPVCISFFLKNDYRLTNKQKTCDWLQNRLVTTTGAAGAAWSAGFSQFTERSDDRGKGSAGFSTRFSTNLAQSSMKATGEFLGGFIFQEDPRREPPYLKRFSPDRLPVRPATGFWNRTRRALMSNVVSYRCKNQCTKAEDVQARPAVGKIAGSFASGFSSMLWAPDRLNTPGRALRRSASTYAGTFSNSLFIEFKPEISAFGKRVARVMAMR